MMRGPTLAVLVALLLPVAAGAVDLQQTPVESSFAVSMQSGSRTMLAAATDDDWTTDESKPPEDTAAAKGPTGRKSIAKAAALSALVPGLGQMYNGRDVKARYFFAAEAVTWVAFGAFRIYGDWKEDDYIAFGNEHASAQLEGKDEEFIKWVRYYADIDDFNAAGRVGDRDRPYLEDSPENHWHWDSEANQQIFGGLVNSAREADRRADFMLWIAALDRVVAVVDAVRDARRINQGSEESWEFGGVKYKFDVNPLSATRQFTLTVYPGF